MKRPSRIHLENEKDRQTISEYLYSMILYFYIKFNKENINEMFENEQVFNLLINKLIDYKELYKDLVISKENFIKLVEKSKNFNHILTFLTYLGKDVIRLLNVDKEKREFILKKIEDEKEEKQAKKEENKGKKEELIIELEKFVEPKKEDNINKIVSLIEQLTQFQASEGKMSYFFLFSLIDCLYLFGLITFLSNNI